METTQPIKTIVAGARQYFADSKSLYERTCFVVMPFGKRTARRRDIELDVDFDWIYKEIFKPAVEAVTSPALDGATLVARRIDEDASSIEDITPNIHSYLEYSRIVLADITGLNPNVFYELGIRHRARKSGTVIFRQEAALIPFDINQFKAFPYCYETPEEVERSRQLIRRALEELLRDDRGESPVHRSGSAAAD